MLIYGFCIASCQGALNLKDNKTFSNIQPNMVNEILLEAESSHDNGGYRHHSGHGSDYGHHNHYDGYSGNYGHGYHHDGYHHDDVGEDGGSYHGQKNGHHYDMLGGHDDGYSDLGHYYGGHHHKDHYGGKGSEGGKWGTHFYSDRGHKKNGYKNTYHKEEFGDYKSYHDIMRDGQLKKDHQDHQNGWDAYGGRQHTGHRGKEHQNNNHHSSAYGKSNRGRYSNSFGDRYSKGKKFYRGGHGHKEGDGHHGSSFGKDAQHSHHFKKNDAHKQS